MSHKVIRGLLFTLLPLLLPACFCWGSSPTAGITSSYDIGRLTLIDQPSCIDFVLVEPPNVFISPNGTTRFSWAPPPEAQSYIITFFNSDNYSRTSNLEHRATYETTETSIEIDTSSNSLGEGTRFVLQLEAQIRGYTAKCLVAHNMIRAEPLVTPAATTTISQMFVPSPTPATCTLTSPLEGLPNGVATFHWNPVPSATNYEIKLYNDQGALLTTLGSPTTPLSADVSQNAIGGQYLITMEFIAYADGVVLCSEQYSAYREAPTAVPATNPPPTLAPTNESTIAPTSEPTPEETPWIDCEDPQIYEVPEWYEYCTGEEWEFYE